MSWSRCSSSILALCDSTNTAASCFMIVGAMQERIGSWFTGVALSVPEIVRMVLLRATSNLLVWVFRHQTGAQYSAAGKTSACVEFRRVLVAVPMWYRPDNISVRPVM